VLLDREAARAELDSPLVHGALWNRDDCGTVHPARLAAGLADAVRRLGVRVFESTPLVRLTPDGAGLHAVTGAGSVRARRVLLATNAFAAGHPAIRRRVVPVRDRILVTEPLDATQRAAVGWANRQGAYDTRTQLNYLRLIRDRASGRDRILFGGKLAYDFGGATDSAVDRDPATYASLADAFGKTFPQLAGVRFSHAWSGPIALTTRMAVHFQRYHGGAAIWAGGYSGFGVSASRFGARLGLALLDGEDLPETRLRLATTMPAPVPPEPLRWLGARITLHAVDTADARGGWRGPWLRLVERLGFPLS
jgi:glycine/D-amino acid oxidase-like deaminating enzyme